MIHLAVPGRIKSPLLRARRDSAAVDSIRHPQHVEQAVSLKPHRRLLAAERRGRARRRTTREGSWTTMRAAPYA